jgi:hypothetical protein
VTERASPDSINALRIEDVDRRPGADVRRLRDRPVAVLRSVPEGTPCDHLFLGDFLRCGYDHRDLSARIAELELHAVEVFRFDVRGDLANPEVAQLVQLLLRPVAELFLAARNEPGQSA